MMEPTESESKEELDRFIEAMETIYGEILEVAEGKVAVEDSVLRNAPHTVDVVSADEWDRPYSRTRLPSRFLRFAPTSTLRLWVVLTVRAEIVTSFANALRWRHSILKLTPSSFDDSMNFCVSRVFRLFVRRRGSGAPGRLTVHT